MSTQTRLAKLERGAVCESVTTRRTEAETSCGIHGTDQGKDCDCHSCVRYRLNKLADSLIADTSDVDCRKVMQAYRDREFYPGFNDAAQLEIKAKDAGKPLSEWWDLHYRQVQRERRLREMPQEEAVRELFNAITSDFHERCEASARVGNAALKIDTTKATA
jgi:hypothetical protein